MAVDLSWIRRWKRYETTLIWNAECEPNSVIETDLLFSNGVTKKLQCYSTSKGTIISHSFSEEVPTESINFNFGGFRIRDIFSTDTTWLERQFSLSEAKSIDEVEAERLAAEAKAEEERIAAEVKAEEERIAAEAKAEEERIAAEMRAQAEDW